MLMGQSYLINWYLQCLLPSSERANISYIWLTELQKGQGCKRWVIWSKLPAQTGLFWITLHRIVPRWETPQPHWFCLFQCLVTCITKKFFLRWNSHCHCQNSLGSAVQFTTDLNPPCCLFIWSTLPEFAYEDIVRDSTKRLPEVKAGNIHCSPLIPSGNCFILEGNQIHETWFTFREFTLTTPDHISVIHVDEDGLQNEGLHHLSRDWGEADWPVVP